MTDRQTVQRLASLLGSLATAEDRRMADRILRARDDEIDNLARAALTTVESSIAALDRELTERNEHSARLQTRLKVLSEALDLTVPFWQLELSELVDFYLRVLDARVPQSPFAPGSIHLAARMPILIDYSMGVRERFEREQERIFAELQEIAAGILADLLEDIELRLLEFDGQSGGVLVRPPRAEPETEPFHPVPLSVEFDYFEDLRVITSGLSFLKSVRPVWLRHLVARVRFHGTPVAELAGAEAGHTSISAAKRNAIRRELMSAIGEQGRRAAAAVRSAIVTMHRRISVTVPLQLRRASRDAEQELRNLASRGDGIVAQAQAYRKLLAATAEAARAVLRECPVAAR
jgi:hypothetical protein